MAYRTSLPLHATELGDPRPLVTKRRKKHARSIRPTSRLNPSGSRSSHLMESGEIDKTKKGYKHVVNPTLFPTKGGGWMEKAGIPGWREAQQRGEVYGFKRRRRAEKFAHGSWKRGADRRSGMKVFREHERERRQNKRSTKMHNRKNK